MKGRVYAFIKKRGGATVDEIAAELKLKRTEVLGVIKEEIKKGLIKELNGVFTVTHFLMPPVKKPAEGIAWEYGKIQKGRVAYDITAPSNVVSPWNKKVAPRQQGDRGICVGESSSELRDYLYLIITKQDPTGTIVRDITDPNAPLAIRDQLYNESFSAQFIYEGSRKEGGVTEPSKGSGGRQSRHDKSGKLLIHQVKRNVLQKLLNTRLMDMLSSERLMT
jgi:hypothetical protein